MQKRPDEAPLSQAKENSMDDHGRRKPISVWGNETIEPGTARDLTLAVGESYSGKTVRIPIHIRRGLEDGPVLFVTAALHGDEINGTGAIHQLLQDPEFKIQRGAIIFAPVLNILGFDRHSRYLPDRRDLNRAFPGSATGSLAGRMARKIFDEIVLRCDYGIDLHTAATRRTNYPNVRGDLNSTKVRWLAEAFASEIIINSQGPQGSFRREACSQGCATIVMEGGEVCKVEPTIVESTLRGINNVLRHLDMVPGETERLDSQIVVDQSKWIRAEGGGFLQFHTKPGDIVKKGQALATNTTLLGREKNTLLAPFHAIIIGMTTLPTISPGEPICHLGKLPQNMKPSEFRHRRSQEDGFEQRVVDELASNVLVVEPSPTDHTP